MGFPDFNNDGHVSLGEGMFALGMIEDADRNDNWNKSPNGGGGEGCGGCLLWGIAIFIGFWILSCIASCVA